MLEPEKILRYILVEGITIIDDIHLQGECLRLIDLDGVEAGLDPVEKIESALVCKRCSKNHQLLARRVVGIENEEIYPDTRQRKRQAKLVSCHYLPAKIRSRILGLHAADVQQADEHTQK